MIDERSLELLKAVRDSGARFKDLRAVVGNPKTLASKLKQLESSGLVEREGKLYRLTERGATVVEKLIEVEKLLRPGFAVENVERIPHAYCAPVVRKFCERLHETFGERLVSVMLFGSLARGDWSRDSDIDVLIVAEGWEEKPAWERIREVRKAEELLERSVEYSRAIDAGFVPIIQPYPLSSSEAKRFNRIYLDAVLDGIVLYDRGGFMANILESLRKRLEGIGARRVTLPNGRYYWVLKEVEAGEAVELG